MPKAIAIFAGDERPLGGCEIYRNTMPLHYLSTVGWETQWVYYGKLYQQALASGNRDLFWAKFIYGVDLLILPRMYFSDKSKADVFGEAIALFHALGIHLVYEVDDDFSNEHRKVIDGDAIQTASFFDAITVTQPYLAKMMTEKTGVKSYILPNMVSPDLWYQLPTFRAYPDKIVIGLTGSTTHKEDWRILATVLPKVVEDNRVQLVLMGYHPDYLEGLLNTDYLPGLTYDRYSQIIQQCDVILAPLNSDPFNLSKSPIKVIEGQSARRVLNGQFAGAACIASNHPVYQPAIKNNKTGLLVNYDPESWQEALDKVIYDDQFRHSLQIQGHEWVQRHYDISKNINLWDNAYRAILAKPLPHTPLQIPV